MPTPGRGGNGVLGDPLSLCTARCQWYRAFHLILHEIEPKIRDPVSLTTTREREEMDGEEERRGGVQVAIVRTVVRSSGEWRIIPFVYCNNVPLVGRPAITTMFQ